MQNREHAHVKGLNEILKEILYTFRSLIVKVAFGKARFRRVNEDTEIVDTHDGSIVCEV